MLKINEVEILMITDQILLDSYTVHRHKSRDKHCIYFEFWVLT